MDVKNIYYLCGFVTIDGTFVSNPNYKTVVAECKIGNNVGYSFYSFLTIKIVKIRNNTETSTIYNTNIIKLENLIDLIENPNVVVVKMKQEENIKRYKAYFKMLYQSQEKFRLEEDGRVMLDEQNNSKNY